jgi:hypothetical protein
MVVRDPLDFSLLLGRDYVYAMKSLVSTLFHVISFPHDGRIVTIDQLSFIGPNWVTSLSGSYMQAVSPPPHVNYVTLSPMTSTSDDLDPVVDMVISSVGLLELDPLTPVLTSETVHPSTERVESVRVCLNNPSRLEWTTLRSLMAPLAALRSPKETKEKSRSELSNLN